MKSQRSLRILRSKNYHQKQSNSPTLASSYSEKRLWAKSFKNEPFPIELKRRLIGHKFKFSDFSDEEEDNNGVVVEEDENEVLEKKKVLPHFKIMSDRGEFLASRSRIKSEQKFHQSEPRCKSVESLRLPQVVEEKKEEDELNKLNLSKLSQFKDRNEFNQCVNRNSDSNSHPDTQSLEPNAFKHSVPERIIENEAQQTKSEKLKQDKSMITSQLQKIIVDEIAEIDDRKKKKEQSQQQIQQIIEEEKQQEQIDNVNKLRISLGKLQHQTSFLNKFMDEELKVSRHNSDSEREEDTERIKVKRNHTHQETINENQQ